MTTQVADGVPNSAPTEPGNTSTAARSIPLGSPPRVRLVFRVGVVGHRPNRLDKAHLPTLAGLISTVLSEVRSAVIGALSEPATAALYSHEPAVLRCVSPLAEGTDRIFARSALALGYDLCCPMPFERSEYERDFVAPHAEEKNSLAVFRALLETRHKDGGLTTFELDGTHAAAEDAYGAAGRLVLNQSDLLVVVWDGDKSAGRGGTVDTLREAISFHVPVLWIDAVAPHPWRVMLDRTDLACLETGGRCIPDAPAGLDKQAERQRVTREVETIVNREIMPLPVQHDEKEPILPNDYFSERRPRWNPAFLWKVFRDAVGLGSFRKPQFSVRDFEGEIGHDWPLIEDRASGVDPSTASHPETVAEWVNRRLRLHYAWADKLADLYADAYRTTYVLTYLIAAVAVFLALLPAAAGWSTNAHHLQAVSIAGELVFLLAVIGLLWRENNRHWHKRWMAYRLLAELVRQLRLLVPLGGGRPIPRLPTHLAVYGDPTRTWMYWHVRALARWIGIPTVLCNPRYARTCLDHIDHIARDQEKGQLRFHQDNDERSKNINHRLHLAALSLFALTVVCVLVHLAPHLGWTGILVEYPEDVDGWITLACGALPALGAGLAGINNQGEFARIAKRSRAMAHEFVRIGKEIDFLKDASDWQGRALTIGEVTPQAIQMAELMVNEVVEWRIVFVDRPATAA